MNQTTIFRVWKLIEKDWKIRLLILFVFMFISGLAELITLGSVLPFLTVLVDPSALNEISFVKEILIFFSFEDDDLLLLFSFIFGICVITSSAIRLVILRINMRWSYLIISELSTEAFNKTLYRPYLDHTKSNSSDLISAVTRKVSTLQTSIIMPCIIFIQNSILSISILAGLLYILPVSNILILSIFILFYALISFVIRKRLILHSEVVAQKEVLAIKTLQESLAGIRDIILGKYHKKFTDDYFEHRRSLDSTSGKIAFLTASPRYLIEGLGIIVIIFLALNTYQTSEKPELVLPSLGVLALGAQRLLPYLQQLYASYATIISSEQSVLDGLEILEREFEETTDIYEEVNFVKSIELRDCSFGYSNESSPVVKSINILIKKGQKVGFIGPTGSGKSTVIDIIMGLLNPSHGSLYVDGQKINEANLVDWQKKIFHVPQQVILSDSSIKNNIAFGVEESDISLQRVKDCCEQAKLSDYIQDLGGNYDSLVGERGVQLSGGQRQRIGIARALYKGGEIIVLDEATNALDNRTESLVNEAIDGLSNFVTKIIVAHNHDTIKNCDVIFILQNGSVVETGTYEEIKHTEKFKEIFGI